MTVAELIERLKECPGNWPVCSVVNSPHHRLASVVSVVVPGLVDSHTRRFEAGLPCGGAEAYQGQYPAVVIK